MRPALWIITSWYGGLAMTPDPKDLPDFFDTNPVDPVQSATGAMVA